MLRAFCGAHAGAGCEPRWVGGQVTDVRVVGIDLAANPVLAERLHVVQRRAYRAEADLIDDDRIPALHETLEDLAAAPLRWTGAFDEGGELVGAVAVTTGGGVTDIDRLVVDPTVHRCGIGFSSTGGSFDRSDGLARWARNCR